MTNLERAVDALSTPDFVKKDTKGRWAEAIEVMDLLDLDSSDPLAVADLIETVMKPVTILAPMNILERVSQATIWSDAVIADMIDAQPNSVQAERKGRNGVRWTSDRKRMLLEGVQQQLSVMQELLQDVESFAKR